MNPSTAFATVLVDELIRNGVREVVLAPGSRSAPLAFAFHAAASSDRIRLHVRVDERGAGFLALGLAKASGRLVPVVTTSGTAAANLHPAVLEASHSGTPMLVLTADRPTELRQSGGNQTVDQVKVYGGAVRGYFDPGTPEVRDGQNGPWRALICRAVIEAGGILTDDPGPVHLNVPMREPLVPDDDPSWPEFLNGRPDGAPWTVAVGGPVEASTYQGAARTLVVLGDAPAEHALAAIRLAEEQGWPVVAEPVTTAAPAALSAGSLLLGMPGFLHEHLPERVLVVGRPTLTRSAQALLCNASVAVDVVTAGPRWADAGSVAVNVLPASALRRSGVPAEPDSAAPGDPSFLAAWQKASAAAADAVARFLDDEILMSGLHVAAAVTRALAAADESATPMLAIGSSAVVRDLDVAGFAGGTHDSVTIANRGAAGIDGMVSTAIGAALAHASEGEAGPAPAYAVMGDLTFLHDTTALMIGPEEPRPDLTLVVVNDNGGGIFSQLEQGAPEHAHAFERIFGTPTGVDLATLCAATGTPYSRVGIREELDEALAWRPGLRVVEVPIERSAVRLLHARLRETVERAVREAV